MRTVEPAWHEFAANLLFTEHGLAPFFAADSRIKAGAGSQKGEFVHDGEQWEVTLYYQESGLVHPGPQTPAGTDFGLDELREYRLQVDRKGGRSLAGFNAHIAPRWEGMEAERDDGSRIEIPVPDGFGEGINVRLKGSNVDAKRYLPLLRAAAEAVGINDWYFGEPHQFSNIQDGERYVRLQDDRSGPVHGRDGPIAQLGHLLENDRDGYRKVVQNDRDEQGRNVPGYYHTVTLGPKRVREAFPDHTFPREIKHYKSREAESMEKSHPLAHPKVGASYQVNRWDDTLRWSDLEEMERQLDQTLLSVLADAGVQVHDGPDGPFMGDPVWSPENVERPDDWLYGLDLTHIRQEQESVVIRTIEDGGFSPIQWDALTRLIADGGEVSPKQIAEEDGWHPDAVRKALRKMEDLLEREYGSVALRSPFIAELVYDRIQAAQESVRDAVGTFAKAVEAGKRGLDETTSAFVAWAAKHDVDVADEREAKMRLRFDGMDPNDVHEDKPAVVSRLRKGFKLWKEAGRDVAKFREADVLWGDGSQAKAGQYLPL